MQKVPLEVIPEHMKWMLTNVFGDKQRNHEYDINKDTNWKSIISGYLLHKFGMLGYLTCHQSFKTRQFEHQFNKVY